jgi:hypothetical protein
MARKSNMFEAIDLNEPSTVADVHVRLSTGPWNGALGTTGGRSSRRGGTIRAPLAQRVTKRSSISSPSSN